MSDRLISVIIPCYNGEKFIAECVESVLQQTYPSFEVIVVNDGSTDKSADIIRRYTDARVTCFYKENGGLSSARNYGITKAKGEAIAFLDCDDTWHRKKLEKLVPYLEGNDLVYSGFIERIEGEGAPVNKQKSTSIPLKTKLLTGNAISGSGSSVVVKHSALVSLGTFREDLAIGEDWELWTRVAWNNLKILRVDEPLVYIRVHQTSIQRTTDKIIWGQSTEKILHSFLTLPGIAHRDKGIIYHRLCINEYQYLKRPEHFVRYVVLSIQGHPTLLFKSNLLLLITKFCAKLILCRK